MPWFWILAAPAIALAWLSLWGERRRARFTGSRLAAAEPAGAPFPPASVIVPVKGFDCGLRENLASLAALDYPDFELIVAARRAADIPAGVLPDGVRVVLAAGGPETASEKVRNLLAAVRAVRKSSEIVAFADSDGRVPPGWLRALAAALRESGVGAATGYRWYAPERARLWTLLRSVWNGAIAGMLGPGGNAFVWGGAMAMWKEELHAARVPERWTNAIFDDYALSDAVRDNGGRIAFAPGAMVASVDGVDARGFFAFARRQLLMTRIYRPALWWSALAAHAVYCGGMTVSIAALCGGRAAAVAALAAQLVPGMAKSAWRARSASAALPGCPARLWAHALLNPAATWLWLITLLLSAFGDSIVWRGTRYRAGRAA